MGETMSPRDAPLLLATEHTEHDAGAEAVGLALARRRGVPLVVVLPVARNAELEMAAPAAAERADAEAARRREALAALARERGVAIDLHLRRGPEPHAEILDEARERGAALLIIRRRGRRGLLANLLVGEMVSQVLAHAPCSVLVVPSGAQLWQRAVLVAVNPQHAADPSLPAAAAALAAECGAALHVVCVAAQEGQRTAAELALKQALAVAAATVPLQAGSAAGAPAARGEVRIGTAHGEVMAAARACGADLLVVGRRHAEPAGHAAARPRLGRVAREITGGASCPVLVHVPSPAAGAPT